MLSETETETGLFLHSDATASWSAEEAGRDTAMEAADTKDSRSSDVGEGRSVR